MRVCVCVSACVKEVIDRGKRIPLAQRVSGDQRSVCCGLALGLMESVCVDSVLAHMELAILYVLLFS